ncbi:rbcL [Symbiodinium microadriaticum]|nr:rbcL [Symbiodinium microadriaticum]CAE7251769.1 rbcL [Symbiodinium sp. KB8]
MSSAVPQHQHAPDCDQDSRVTRRTLDPSSRYADLSLDEATLIKNDKHVLISYIMKPKALYDYLATAAHFAAES